jgi:hypothetical protein
MELHCRIKLWGFAHRVADPNLNSSRHLQSGHRAGARREAVDVQSQPLEHADVEVSERRVVGLMECQVPGGLYSPRKVPNLPA